MKEVFSVRLYHMHVWKELTENVLGMVLRYALHVAPGNMVRCRVDKQRMWRL